MMGEIAKDTKTRLLEVFYAVYEKDARKVMAELVALGALVPTGDQTSVSQLKLNRICRNIWEYSGI
jgi:predicted unusual protein kinase regulating ubiquinone biosynthesis (AarF/ABC1/UbiB family)